jgi:hypothetical protein
MAKFTVERWRCDRCGLEAASWLKPGSTYGVMATVDYGTAGGELLKWREMCVPCNDEVAKEIDAMQKSAKAAALLRKEPLP